MAKKSTIFFCQNCGYESAKWLGQCPACKEWNTLVEETVVTGKAGKSSKKTESLAARIYEAAQKVRQFASKKCNNLILTASVLNYEESL